ncbi:hypothetical protein ACIQNG_11220 [Streptomyces sp. NPDC091377]|uniref:hypothetical protein n=1 Tax=Streptomyces sp. NPDC091377 TaxID=3365995 RepID=UPI00381EC5AA
MIVTQGRRVLHHPERLLYHRQNDQVCSAPHAPLRTTSLLPERLRTTPHHLCVPYDLHDLYRPVRPARPARGPVPTCTDLYDLHDLHDDLYDLHDLHDDLHDLYDLQDPHDSARPIAVPVRIRFTA